MSEPAERATEGGAEIGARGLLKRYRRVLQAGVLALVLVFLGAAVWRSWSGLSHYTWHVEWGLLVAAFALFVAQELSYGFIWRDILARMGSRLDPISAQRIYLGAEFVRYIPGNVWHVITRVLWAERRGVPKSTGFASMVLELATKLTSGALVFAVSLFFWQDTGGLFANLNVPRSAFIAAGALLIPLLLLGLYPPFLRGALNAGLRRLKREPVRFSLRYGDVLLVTLYWSLSWLVAGVGFYLLVRSIVTTPLPPAALLLCIGINAIIWDIGFLSFITPSGLGIRELAAAFLLVQSALVVGTAGATLAAVVAILARLLTTGSELVCIAVAHALPGPTPPASGVPDAAAVTSPSAPLS